MGAMEPKKYNRDPANWTYQKHLHLRATPEQIDKWKVAAAKSEVEFSRWVRDALDRAAKRAK